MRFSFVSFPSAVLTTLCLVSSLSMRAAADLTVYTDKSLFDSAVSTVHLVNFDTDAAGASIASGDIIASQYSAWDAKFGPFHGGTPRALSDTDPDTDNLPALSSPNRVWTATEHGNGGGGFVFQSGHPVAGVGLSFGDIEFAGSTVEAFDSSGKSLGSTDIFANVGNSPFEWKFLGFRSSSGIAQLRVAFSGDDYVTVDNLQIGPSVVPEPGILTALASLGFAGVFLRRRRR